MNAREKVRAAAAQDRLDELSEDELVDAAAEDYDGGSTLLSLVIGMELGRRGWLPTREQHARLHLRASMPVRED